MVKGRPSWVPNASCSDGPRSDVPVDPVGVAQLFRDIKERGGNINSNSARTYNMFGGYVCLAQRCVGASLRVTSDTPITKKGSDHPEKRKTKRDALSDDSHIVKSLVRVCACTSHT